MEIGWANDRLAIGSAVESQRDARQVEACGITHVLNLRDGDKHPEHVMDEAQWFAKQGTIYLNNPTHDDGQKKPPEWFKTSIDFVLHALVADPKNKILVHCKDGTNRAPSTAYAVLQALGADSEHALEHVKDARP